MIAAAVVFKGAFNRKALLRTAEFVAVAGVVTYAAATEVKSLLRKNQT